jgi:hypothetical protein
MPTPIRSYLARLVSLALFTAATAALGACSLLPPGAIPEALNPILVGYEASGGLCPEGPCGFRAEIRRDGTVTRSEGMAQTVDSASLERLTREIDTADWDAILAKPFTGQCPTIFDGQEATYTFHAGTAPVVVASCTTLVDPLAEPFLSIGGILFGSGG